MTPDVEELIKRVNTLTLDKNRLRQKLNQLTSNQNGGGSNCIASPPKLSHQQSSRDSMESSSSSSNLIIAGIECSTSSESDILYINELYRKRLDDYNDKWELMQSKCSALLSELNALQKNHVRLRKENLELEDRLRCKCDENDQIKGELQTVVLNYETQLSAMSEHLSSITRQISLEDGITSLTSTSSAGIRNPNYID